MKELSIMEVELVCGAMGSRGAVAPQSPAQTACSNGAVYGALGGGIAAASGGMLGIALGALGGFIAGAGSAGCFAN